VAKGVRAQSIDCRSLGSPLELQPHPRIRDRQATELMAISRQIEKIAYLSAARRFALVVDYTSTLSGVVGRRPNYLIGMSVCFENHPMLGTEPQNILTEGTYLVMLPVGAVRAKTSKRQFKTSAT